MNHLKTVLTCFQACTSSSGVCFVGFNHRWVPLMGNSSLIKEESRPVPMRTHFLSLQTASPHFFSTFHRIQCFPCFSNCLCLPQSVVFIGSNPLIPFEFNLFSLLFSWYNISNKDLHRFGVALFISLPICMV